MAEIVIIGGGVAGLSAGIYAQLNGHNAVIYEKHFKAGGNLTGWDRLGYHIDNCIHWLTGTNPATKQYKIWKDLGALGEVEIYQPETLYSFEKDGMKLSLCKDLMKFKKDMLAISPEDRKEINSLIRAIKTVQGMNGTAGIEHNEKYSAIKKIFAAPALLKYNRLTTKDLADRFRHPVIKGFLNSLFSDYFNSLAFIMVAAVFTGANGGVPAGGSCAMVDRMVEKFCSLGGQIKLNMEAVKINIKNNLAESVTFKDGETRKGDYFLLASDPAMIFGKLLDRSHMPKAMRKQYMNPKLKRFSSYHCAFACELNELPFEGDMAIEIPDKHKGLLNADYVMVREFSREKKYAPKGKNIIQTMTYCLEEDAHDFIELRKDIKAYKERKQNISKAIEEIILDKYPELKEQIKCIDIWTPATYRRYTNSEIGSFMSFAFPAKIFPRKVTNRVDNVKNVILATQWLQAPGGLPIAAGSGKKAIDTIVKKESR